MHFPKRSNFQVSLLPTLFFSKSIFFETKLFSLKLSNRRKNNQDTIISVFQNMEHVVIIQQRAAGDKNKFQSKHSLSLIGGYFSSFHCPNDVQYRDVSVNKYSEDKTSKQIEKQNKNQCHNISIIYSTPKNETLVFISQIIRLKQKINFHCKAVVSRDFQTPVYRFW